MDNRFERVSDASYAWGQRSTYIKELEELNINVQDLILGISLRIHNPATNHYFGSIGRLGRALAESKQRSEIGNVILAAVSDPELDYYNRMLMYFLYRNYTEYVKDESLKKQNDQRLAEVTASLPDFLQRQLVEE